MFRHHTAFESLVVRHSMFWPRMHFIREYRQNSEGEFIAVNLLNEAEEDSDEEDSSDPSPEVNKKKNDKKDKKNKKKNKKKGGSSNSKKGNKDDSRGEKKNCWWVGCLPGRQYSGRGGAMGGTMDTLPASETSYVGIFCSEGSHEDMSLRDDTMTEVSMHVLFHSVNTIINNFYNITSILLTSIGLMVSIVAMCSSLMECHKYAR